MSCVTFCKACKPPNCEEYTIVPLVLVCDCCGAVGTPESRMDYSLCPNGKEHLKQKIRERDAKIVELEKDLDIANTWIDRNRR